MPNNPKHNITACVLPHAVDNTLVNTIASYSDGLNFYGSVFLNMNSYIKLNKIGE